MGRCPISKMIVVDLQGIFLHFFHVFSYSISHVESSLIPYIILAPLKLRPYGAIQMCILLLLLLYLGLPAPLASPSVALIIFYFFKIFILSKPGLVLSVTRILRAALTEFPVFVCVCVCVCTCV